MLARLVTLAGNGVVDAGSIACGRKERLSLWEEIEIQVSRYVSGWVDVSFTRAGGLGWRWGCDCGSVGWRSGCVSESVSDDGGGSDVDDDCV